MVTERKGILPGFWFGLLTTGILLTVNWLVNLVLGVPILGFVVIDWAARNLPGDVVTWGIDRLIDVIMLLDLGDIASTAKVAEKILGVGAVILAGGVLGALVGFLVKDARVMFLALLGMLPSWGLAIWANDAPIASIVFFTIGWLVWGSIVLYVVGQYLHRTQPQPEGNPFKTMTRRRFLWQASIWMGITTGALSGLNVFFDQTFIRNPLAGIPLPRTGLARILRGELEDNFDTAPGTRPEITPMGDFYRIDINILPPNVNADEWRLAIRGLVDNPFELTYDEVLNLETVEQYATLECISNPVGGDLIDTTLFSGVRLKTVLEMAGLQDNALEIRFESEDGYHETLPVADALRDETLLVYGMGGNSLEVKHGFPLRLYTPNRFGMKNPKWIHTITAIGRLEDGYWAERNWDKDAFIKITTVIDPLVSDLVDGRLAVGGIAFAGDRGVSRVEVRVDDGDWMEATLREPLSELAWVQWRADVPFERGVRKITARCYDGNGVPQIEEETDNRPSGATGYHSVSERE